MGAETLSLGCCERNDRWNSDEKYYVALRVLIERLDGYIGKGAEAFPAWKEDVPWKHLLYGIGRGEKT